MKIEIKIEGENIGEILEDMLNILENNKEGVKKILRLLAREAIEVLEEDAILDKGAELYIRLNRAINYRYRKGK
ncbi:MAG: hypothetical protein DRN29_03270 [Thermoplasmata archaeon]|nr:MAG: hypothetical protein DRN29_03270 [Thermoplasmata archaeon]